MFFEEFEVSSQITTPQRRITEADLDAFLGLSGLHLPLFEKDAAARQMGHPFRLVPGPMILSVAMGLVRKVGWFDRVVAVVRFEGLVFKRPVHPGHSVQSRITVKGKRPTRNPQRGLVILGYHVVNQNGRTVLVTDGTYLMQTKRGMQRTSS